MTEFVHSFLLRLRPWLVRTAVVLLLAGWARAAGHADNVYAVGFAPDGKTFATGSDDGTLQLWPGGVRLAEEATSVDSLQFSPDGRWLAAAAGQGRILVWSCPPAGRPHVLQLPIYRCVVRFSREHLAVGARDGSVRLFTLGDWREVRHWDTGHGAVSGLSFRSDGRLLAVSSWWDDTASLWDVSTGQERAVLRGHTASVYCVAFDPRDGSRVATGSRDGTLRLWSAADGRQLDCRSSVPGFIHGLDWSPNGAWIATAHEDSCTRLWDVAARRVATVIGTPEPLPAAEYSQGVAFSPDSSRVAIGRRWGNVREATVPEGQLVLDVPRLPRMTVVNLALSPSGRRLAVAWSDRTVAVWDLSTRRLETWQAEHRRVQREFASNQLERWPGRLEWVGEEVRVDWDGTGTWPAVHGVGERVQTQGGGRVYLGGLGVVKVLEGGREVGRLTLSAPEGAQTPTWEVTGTL